MEPSQTTHRMYRNPVYYWVFALLIIACGYELYRFIQYIKNWQFLLTITSGWNFWLMANLAFVLFASAIPILAGLVFREIWAPAWSIRYLVMSAFIGVGRIFIFSTDPFAPIHWLNIGLQTLFAIILVVLLIFGNPRKVIYAEQE